MPHVLAHAMRGKFLPTSHQNMNLCFPGETVSLSLSQTSLTPRPARHRRNQNPHIDTRKYYYFYPIIRVKFFQSFSSPNDCLTLDWWIINGDVVFFFILYFPTL